MRETVWSARQQPATPRETVDLSDHEDLVVIYVGLQVRSPRGLWHLVRFVRAIRREVARGIDGLLNHEHFTGSLFPPHLVIRQYWRNFGALERWSRESVHRAWWVGFFEEPSGLALWHEAYSLEGGFEAIYDGVHQPTGLATFAPRTPARGSLFTARRRLRKEGRPSTPAPIRESALYGPDEP